MMDEFKDSKSLYDERKKKGKINEYERRLPEAGKPRPGRRDLRRPKETPPRICEQWDPVGCKASQEAVRLGLAKTIQFCHGLIPPVCSIRKRLAAGTTVQELYQSDDS